MYVVQISKKGPSSPWSYGSWFHNYLCNRCLSPRVLWVRLPLRARCTRYNIMWSSLSGTCSRSVVFSGSSTNKTDRHDITEILLKVALNTIIPKNPNQRQHVLNGIYRTFLEYYGSNGYDFIEKHWTTDKRRPDATWRQDQVMQTKSFLDSTFQ